MRSGLPGSNFEAEGYILRPADHLPLLPAKRAAPCSGRKGRRSTPPSGRATGSPRIPEAYSLGLVLAMPERVQLAPEWVLARRQESSAPDTAGDHKSVLPSAVLP